MFALSTSPDPSFVICHICGETGYYGNGCAVPVKGHGKSNKHYAATRRNLVQGAVLG